MLDIIVTAVRVAILLTFLITASSSIYLIIKVNLFIRDVGKRYIKAQEEEAVQNMRLTLLETGRHE